MPNPQQRIGEYVLDEKIGAGAFGQVWRAHHHVWIDQLVAIKIPTDPTYRLNLQREGAAVRGLEHPNIVRALAFDPFAPEPYLAMEYVPGTSLRPLIRQMTPTARLPVADVVAIMRQILAGLVYAHGRGIVHRDLKPENVLCHQRAAELGYGAQGVIKITDFGFGRTAVGGPDSIVYSASLNDPAGRELAGTLDYMAPEQRTAGAADARADLYSCGVILYELLTGEKPAGTEVPSDLNKAVPPRLDEVFRRSYARLERRYASADEFAGALAGMAPSPVTVPPIPSQPAPAARAAPVCPHCHGRIAAHDQFCIHCGTRLVAVVPRCSSCGAYPDRGDRFCIFCGTGITAGVAL